MVNQSLRAAVRCACVLTFLWCAAWGATGHKVTAQIAYEHLTPKAKEQVDGLLQGSTLPEFSIWADQIKGDPAWKWTKSWHFADMPEGASEFKMDRDCPEEGCVVKGIQRYTTVLKSNSTTEQEKVQALKFLVHFVGDIHQPLHVGHKADKGGNAIQVKLYSRGENLHAVWDDGLIRRRGMDFGPYTAKLEAGLTPEKQKAFLAVMDPVAWASESHRLAEEFAYKDEHGKTIAPGDTLGDGYAQRCTPVVDEQLAKAGIRLAALLNSIYDPGVPTPEVAAPASAPTAAPASPTSPKNPGQTSSTVKFVGSKNSQVYHYPGCADAQKIKPGNLVEYTEAPAGKRLHQGCPR